MRVRGDRDRRGEERAGRGAPRREDGARTRAEAAGLLGLQRSAGNRAVVQLLASGGYAPVQRKRQSYPAVIETLGTLGYYPSHPKGWYRGDDHPDVGSQKLTSYNPGSGPRYGILDNKQGYEIVRDPDAPNGWRLGNHQYMVYDAKTGWLRAAAVNEKGRLTLPSRDAMDFG